MPFARSFVYTRCMKGNVNFYFAMLIMFIAGAGAAWFIIHIVQTNAFTATFGGSEASYSSLQQSILGQ